MNLKIVIIGAGEVGFNLAKHLSKEDYNSNNLETITKFFQDKEKKLSYNEI